MTEFTPEEVDEIKFQLNEMDKKLKLIKPKCTEPLQVEIVEVFETFLDKFRVRE